MTDSTLVLEQTQRANGDMTVATHLKTESQGNDRRCPAIRSWRTHAVWADFPPPGSNTEGRGNCPQERVSQLCTDPLVDKCLTAGKQRLEANVPELCRQKREATQASTRCPRAGAGVPAHPPAAGRGSSPRRRRGGRGSVSSREGCRLSKLNRVFPPS